MSAARPSRPHRLAATVVGALAILAVALYGSATLVGPLPSAEAEVLEIVPAAASVPPRLPEDGSNGLALGAERVLASSGIAEPVPMGGTAKIVTALVLLDRQPMEAGRQGQSIAVTAADYADLLRYASESARTVPLIEGEVWTQREMLQAMLLGSSNNHADALARWGFGSIDGYLDAAKDWLAKRGLSGMTVVDATGLAEGSQSSGADAARLAAMAFADPVVAEIIDQDSVTVAGRRVVDNEAAYRSEDGIAMLSRSFTDQAGLCVLFAADVTTASGAARVYGAFLREPDYETLNADLTALLLSASAGLAETPVISEGSVYARYETAWGDTANAVASSTVTRTTWATSSPSFAVDAQPQTVVAKGADVGRVTAILPDGDASVILRTDGRLGDPGPFWRLAHPIPVIEALVRSFASR